MTNVRPFTYGDAPAVATLYERVMRSRTDDAPPLLAPALVRYFLDHPWADPEIPALVCEGKGGRILGFIGSTVRRMIFDGRPVRLGCSGPLLRSPEPSAGMVGALLQRAYLAGRQDFSVTDGATPDAARLWIGMGGRAVDLPSLDWMKVFRPARFAVEFGFDRLGLTRWKPAASALGTPLDAVARRRLGAGKPDDTVSEELSPDALAAFAEEGTGWARLRPAYDRPFADWLFAEMGALPSRGPLSRRLVRDREGRVLGWHVAFVPPGGIAEVMQVVAKPRMAGAVIDDLFHTMDAAGAAGVRGRLEAPLQAALAERGVLIRRGVPALIHTRSRELLSAIALGEAVLTRLDGEWWLPLHLERYETVPAKGRATASRPALPSASDAAMS
ncbi:hypothetical protein [Azospirillum sp.]|uniref:hypothetical protein n=1 Tax=Azospirillum sp. TaxID=34012 RepID=UPI002D54D09E|nr:hypothetical protein [Azospirillum sp.]HYD70265.1 hypothetical protein [Azospirillum sp.]